VNTSLINVQITALTKLTYQEPNVLRAQMYPADKMGIARKSATDSRRMQI
jgi:hypothetical protein